MRLLLLPLFLLISYTSGAQGCIDSTLIQTGHYCFDSPNMDFPNYFNPVCSCDGQTIDNSCIAQYHYGYTNWTEGPCVEFYTYLMTTFIEQGYLTYGYYSKTSGIINVLIYNEMGHLLFEYRDPVQTAGYPVIKNFFDVSFLSKGFYMFYLEKDGIQEVHKFVKATDY